MKRIGLHYFIKEEHLMTADAEKWSRILNSTGINWLVLKNPEERAIPEPFIKELISHNIEIIIDFNIGLKAALDLSSIETILNVYGKWGVKYACLFQSPNRKANWGDNSWNKLDIVENHASQFLEFAKICIKNNIHPILSPLSPGGDYWDLAFLEKSLELINNSADPYIIKKMVLSAFGWFWNRDIDWGIGGKAKWPKAKPFGMPKDYQNQMGFRTYQWYLEISDKVLGKKLPIIIFEAGKSDLKQNQDLSHSNDYKENLSDVLGLLQGKNVFARNNLDKLHPAIGNDVIACCFYLLSAEKDEKLMPYRWFEPDGKLLFPAKIAMKNNEQFSSLKFTNSENSKTNIFKFQRYIYIDRNLKNNMPVILEKLDAYMKRYKPHLGFSLLEARNSAHLLVITDQKESFKEEFKDLLPKGNITRILSPDELINLMKEK